MSRCTSRKINTFHGGSTKNTLSDGTEAENVDVELLNTRFTPINLAETPAVAADGTIARPDVIPVAVAEQDGSASLPFYARTMRPTPLRLEKSLPTSTLRWSIRNPVHGPAQGRLSTRQGGGEYAAYGSGTAAVQLFTLGGRQYGY